MRVDVSPLPGVRAATMIGGGKRDGAGGTMARLGVRTTLAAALFLAATAAAGAEDDLFESVIRPVLVERCQGCHASDGVAEGGLVLDHRDGLRAGGAGGPTIVPGDPASSRLLAILRHEVPGLEMPKGEGRLDPATIDAFAAWIAAGAPDPREPSGAGRPPVDFAERRRRWSFVPLAAADPAPARRPEWDGNPIDRFLLPRIEAAGLEPAAPADPATLLRRLSLVLTGLPPTAEEVEAFVADPSPGAWERAVDGMLASPRYGERFARHWMDLVRYCESHGSQGDPELPDAWRYRDYLVRAFNEDVPYDRLVREHLAGDLLPDPRRTAAGLDESAVGTAHLRMVELGFVPVDALDDHLKVVENQIDVVSKTFLALTVACARCHDHKFDPVTQEDYTALHGIFASCRPGHSFLDPPDALRAGEAELSALKDSIRAGLADAWLDAAARLPARFARRAERATREADLAAALRDTRAAIEAIEAPARAAALARHGPWTPAGLVAAWSFDGDARDRLGGHHGELRSGATVRDGRLVLDGLHANVRTAPLAADLTEKTFEAWVTLADLAQRGGGVIGVDVPEGRFFDSIVFGEIVPRRWLAGSDFFNRTRDPEGPEETAGPADLIHVAVVWGADGSIRLYRDGVPHGTPYTKAPPRTFRAGESRFLFGQRLSDVDPPLAGSIEEARAYGRALGGEEIAASFRAGPEGVPDEAVLAALDDVRRRILLDLRAAEARIDGDLRALAAVADAPLERALGAARGDASHPLHAWLRLAETPPGGRTAAWHALVESLAAERRAIAESREGTTTLWDLRGEDRHRWFRHGGGPPDALPREGEFAVVPDGDRIVAGILPAGIYSHLVSSRRPAVFQSPRFVIASDSIHLRVAGRGSVARIVIENYPLGNGGIYPAVRPDRDAPSWIRLDTAYRRGSHAYVELATDPPGPGFIGIGAVMAGDGPAPPRDPGLAAAPFLDGPPPADAADHAARIASRLESVVAAWRDGALDEDSRAALDVCVREGVLPTTTSELPDLRERVERYRAIEKRIPSPSRAPGVFEAEGHDERLLVRGQHHRPDRIVERRGLSLFGSTAFAERARAAGAPSGRLQLAEEMLGPGRDLLARVMVNRLWHHVFGRGIVATTDNFGHLGSPPSHPELLDWLAERFVADGWSVKRAIRRMVTSRAFRGSTRPPPGAGAVDPRGELLSHAVRRRLDAESIRDCVLAVSGELDTTIGGPGVDPRHTAKTEGGGPSGPLDGDRRRSIYLRVRRNACDPFLEVFDAPKPTTTRGSRDVTAGPVQSLAMLNDPFIADQAAKWGARVAAAPGGDAERLRGMFLRAVSRPPDADEAASLLAHLAAARSAATPGGAPAADPAAVERGAWTDVAHAVFCLGEFLHAE